MLSLCFVFQLGPLKLTQCNLHSDQTTSGLSLQLRAVNVAQFLLSHDGPWLQVQPTVLLFGVCAVKAEDLPEIELFKPYALS